MRGFNRAFAEPYGSTQVQQPPGTAPLNAFCATSLPWRSPCRYSSVFDIRGCISVSGLHPTKTALVIIASAIISLKFRCCMQPAITTYRHKPICACSPLSSFFSWRWSLTLLLLLFSAAKNVQPQDLYTPRKTPPHPTYQESHTCAHGFSSLLFTIQHEQHQIISSQSRPTELNLHSARSDLAERKGRKNKRYRIVGPRSTVIVPLHPRQCQVLGLSSFSQMVALADQAAVNKEFHIRCCGQPRPVIERGLAFYQLQLRVYAIVIFSKNYDHQSHNFTISQHAYPLRYHLLSLICGL